MSRLHQHNLVRSIACLTRYGPQLARKTESSLVAAVTCVLRVKSLARAVDQRFSEHQVSLKSRLSSPPSVLDLRHTRPQDASSSTKGTATSWHSAKASAIDSSEPNIVCARCAVGQHQEGGFADSTLPVVLDVRSCSRRCCAQDHEDARPSAHCLSRHTDGHSGYASSGWIQLFGTNHCKRTRLNSGHLGAINLTVLQKVSYAKSKSNIIAKLDGTFKIPTSANAPAEMTDLQQSIFNAPPPGSNATAAPSAPSALPSKPPAAAAAADENRGQKRAREDDDEDEDSDVAMEEDSDDD